MLQELLTIAGESCRKKISFKNNIEGFLKFEKWMYEIQSSQQKTSILIGMEPTGQYWENFAYYLQEKQYSVVTVNPMHVKKSKEFEDNNQTKTDAKDARIIATLVKDGRFNYPNLLEGEYADLREAMNVRRANLQNLQRTKNRMHRWFDRYFPEFREIFKSWESKALLYLLDRYGLPDEIAQKDPLEVYESLPKNIRMANGKTKILKIHKVCKTSIGSQKSFFGKHEFSNLLNTYEFYQKEIEQIEEIIEEISSRIDEVQKIREIKGIGLISASGIVAELGNI